MDHEDESHRYFLNKHHNFEVHSCINHFELSIVRSIFWTQTIQFIGSLVVQIKEPTHDAHIQLVRFEPSITLGFSQTKLFPFLLVQVVHSTWSMEITRQVFFLPKTHPGYFSTLLLASSDSLE
jgi:hypothetical protein